MSDFLIQTLVWTGALIALVLVLRRPVARHFGSWPPPVSLPADSAGADSACALLHAGGDENGRGGRR